MEVKDMGSIQSKFVNRASVAAPDYERGVKAPRRPWAQATQAAEANYVAGVQAAASKGRFGRGVAKAGDAKFQRGAIEKGIARFGAGVAAAAGDFAAGFEPFRAALQGTTLPPRKARRDPSNLARVGAVVTTMIRTAEAQGR